MSSNAVRKYKRNDMTGVPFPPPHAKHEVFAGMVRHPNEEYRYGSVKLKRQYPAVPKRTVLPGNPAMSFKPSPAFAKADHAKAAQL